MLDFISEESWRDFNAVEVGASTSSNIQCFAYNPKIEVMMVVFKYNMDEAYNYKVSPVDLRDFLLEAVHRGSWGGAYSKTIRTLSPAYVNDAGIDILKCAVPLRWMHFMDKAARVAGEFDIKSGTAFNMDAFYEWLCIERFQSVSIVKWEDITIDPGSVGSYSF